MEYRFVEVSLLFLTGGALFFTAEIFLSTASVFLKVGLISVFLGLFSILPVAYLGIRRGVKSVENPEQKLTATAEKSIIVALSSLPVMGLYLFWDRISWTLEGVNRELFAWISGVSSPIDPIYVIIAYVGIAAGAFSRYTFQIIRYRQSIQYEKKWTDTAIGVLESIVSHTESTEVDGSPPSNISNIISSLEALSGLAEQAPADIDDEVTKELEGLSMHSHKLESYLADQQTTEDYLTAVDDRISDLRSNLNAVETSLSTLSGDAEDEPAMTEMMEQRDGLEYDIEHYESQRADAEDMRDSALETLENGLEEIEDTAKELISQLENMDHQTKIHLGPFSFTVPGLK